MHISTRADTQLSEAWWAEGHGTRSGIFNASLEGDYGLKSSCLADSQDGCIAHGAGVPLHDSEGLLLAGRIAGSSIAVLPVTVARRHDGGGLTNSEHKEGEE
jgi:hypothetical protein